MSGQRLNSLDRFRKQSPNLLLEEHGSCEVPAGCGGVVLRWRNPHAARPLIVFLYTAGSSQSWVDGQLLSLGRLDLPPGRHVFTVALEQADRTAGLLMAALVHNPTESIGNPPAGLAETALHILSRGDGTWKYTLDPPGDDWHAVGFDEHYWQPLVEAAIPEVDWSAPGGAQWHACHREGAPGLRIPALPRRTAKRGPVWIRKVFDIPTLPS